MLFLKNNDNIDKVKGFDGEKYVLLEHNREGCHRLKATCDLSETEVHSRAAMLIPFSQRAVGVAV